MNENDEAILCDMFSNSSLHYCKHLYIAAVVTSSLSIALCGLALLVMLLFQLYKNLTQRLIFYLIFSCFLNSITYLVGSPAEESTACSIKGLIQTYTDWMLLLWICCIVHNNYENIVKYPLQYRFEWLYIAMSFLLPIVIACLPLGNLSNYGPSGTWCWIKSLDWQTGMWYVPVLILIAFMFAAYIFENYYDLRRNTQWRGWNANLTAKEFHRVFIKPLRYYPLMYLILNVNGLSFITRFEQIMPTDEWKYFFYIFLSLTIPLTGAMMAIVFFCDRQTRLGMKRSNLLPFLKCCCLDNDARSEMQIQSL